MCEKKKGVGGKGRARRGGHKQRAELLDKGLEVRSHGLERAHLVVLLCERAVGLAQGDALRLDIALAVLECGNV